MPDTPYSNRELDHFFKDFKAQLTRIEAQTTKTNGTVRWHTRVLLVVGAVIATLLVTNGSELISIFKLII